MYIHNLGVSQLRICRPHALPPPPPLRFDTGFMKDAEWAETLHKNVTRNVFTYRAKLKADSITPYLIKNNAIHNATF